MNTLRHGSRARLAAVGVAASSAILLAGCGAANETAPPAAGGDSGATTDVSGTLAGAGASSQQAAMEAWIAGFSSVAPDVTVNYDPVGSGGGRTQFTEGAVQFAGTDAALDEEELPAAQQVCGGPDNVIQMPLYISPIAVVFNLEGVDNLQLAPSTIAQIFNRQITTWNDPAIAADNPGVQLPATPITPVNRADESGTTENFTEYLVAAAGADWPHEADGNWPVQGGEAAQGTSGVVGAVQGGQGTIGYADLSQAGELGTVDVRVGDAFVNPSPEAAAAIVEASPRIEGQGNFNFAVELARDNPAAGTYPIVLVSYTLACTQYSDPAQADAVRAFLNYIASEEGQAAASENAGNAPISASQRSTFQPAIDAIAAAG
ncbi:phosphate ABC transporter substrate-binding protein (PhoT family) [Pseudonocardia kunmingensis]|uniref:Phosphate-binding protein n=1 Tax=Pseudonocardia kunmingensis TaxID=630975 RepID=A0A543DAL8_9PSEU|nr:phosphate ABC transporter substrate-binding protein PstS [Pseudonocardia kunmingensis]TQM06335.1 phosphate ABC transporter substrate-binding protein (PhoT family) [Pseudonocardia kunmingensis]